jgi:choline dehydrogenase-like flavoprotein
MKRKIDAFKKFAHAEGYETVQVISQAPDPDGGFKAIVEAHNVNPITWASEQYHRAKLGVKHGVEQGRKKAEIKHQISQAAEIQATGEREVALQRARLARLRAAAPVRIETEAEAGRLLEERRRQRRLAALQPGLQAPQQSMEEYVFGTQMP